MQLNFLQKFDKFAIKRVVERIRFLDCVVLVAFEIVGAFAADVYAEHFTTCYKRCEVEKVREIPLHSRRFEFEPELTTKLLKRGYKIVEVPISFKGRSYGEGKKIKPKDGLIAIWTLLKYRFVD